MVLSLFSIPVSGILGQSSSMAAIADNIANQNSPGSKTSSVRFRPLLAQQFASSLGSSAHGLNPYVRHNIDRQGITLPTGKPLDLALNGGGFFALQHPQTDEVVYSRNGQFRIVRSEDGRAYLGDSDGYYVLGWPIDGETERVARNAANLERIPFDNSRALSGTASSTASIEIVLPQRGGSVFRHELGLIDSNGVTRDISVSYRRGEAGTLEGGISRPWTIVLTDSDGQSLGEALLGFDEGGRLQSLGEEQTTTFAIRGEGLNVVLDLSQVRQFGSVAGSRTPVVLRTQSDGAQGGRFVSHEIDNSGYVRAVFSNGEDRPTAQLALADLVNPNNLEPLSGTKFRRSETSGEIDYYDLQRTRRAELIVGYLESSTTELAEAFTSMIQTQSAYNLSALSLQTINQITQTATEIKR